MQTRLSQKVFSSIASRGFKVSILGAGGGCGQAISLLCKLNPRVSHLSLYDIRGSKGVGADLSHICTRAVVTGHCGPDELAASLKDSKVVIIPAGVPRALGDGKLNRDSLFDTNAGIIKNLAEACVKNCPDAMLLIISNPVNSLVPLIAEVYKRAGVYDKRRLFGITALDVMRANTFVAANQNFDITKLKNVTVVGGHGGTTILPLLSQVPNANFNRDDIAKLTHRIKYGGDEVVEAKQGAGSATLSLAYSVDRFTRRLLDAMSGEADVIECAFVENDITRAPFFATPLRLGPNGVEEVIPYGAISNFEQNNLNEEIHYLVEQAQRGVDFVKNWKASE